ncbi:MAG: cytochrome c biogenesis protein CcdA [Rhodospirillales bacterium]|nr:cytochrome c biogenesis protein CcdA [Rhodospirillales bacterium]
MEIGGVGIFAAFLAGVISFLSPCVLPLVPGYVSYVAGRSLDQVTGDRVRRTNMVVLGHSFYFVLGFSVVFIALGASASAIGSILRGYLYEAGYIAGGVIIIFGLHMTGLVRLKWLNRDIRFVRPFRGGSPLGALVLGMAFAFGWTPCIGPILGAVLTLGASTLGVAEGATLLAIYSLGLAVPFLLVAEFTDRFLKSAKIMKRIGRQMQTVAGTILVLVGIGMATGQLNYFGTWLLNTFPGFQSLVI